MGNPMGVIRVMGFGFLGDDLEERSSSIHGGWLEEGVADWLESSIFGWRSEWISPHFDSLTPFFFEKTCQYAHHYECTYAPYEDLPKNLPMDRVLKLMKSPPPYRCNIAFHWIILSL
jgi:hypothetical protein